MKSLHAGLAVLAMTASAACARQAQVGSPPASPQQAASPASAPVTSSCVAPPAGSTANVGATTLGGRFKLEMVATLGAKAGSRATGSLTLEPVDAGGSVQPLSEAQRELATGTTNVDIGAVGAMAPGSVQAGGNRPVQVVQWRAGPGDIQTLMRVGSSPPPPAGKSQIEGTYLSLTVQSLSPSRVGGTWKSGSGMAESAGYFCADR